MASIANAYLSTYPGNEMTPTDFALALEHISLSAKGKLSGVIVTSTGAVSGGIAGVAVSPGWCLLLGRIVLIEACNLDVELAATGTATRYVVLKVDLSGSSEVPATIEIMNSVPTDSSNFNISEGSAYLQLASITVSTAAITGIANIGLIDISSEITRATGLLTTSTVKPVIKKSIYVKDVTKDGKTVLKTTWVVDNVTIKKGEAAGATINISQNGYTPIALRGFWVGAATTNGKGASNTRWHSVRIVDNNLIYSIRNIHSSDSIKIKMQFFVTYVANS